MKGKYRVEYERDESGVWVASVPDIAGCHTQGRTIDEARRRIVEAIAASGGNAAAELVDDVRLPAEAAAAIREYADARTAVEVNERRARLAARRAVRVLQGSRLRMSARDAGRVLGLSHQRVHQIATGAESAAVRRRR